MTYDSAKCCGIVGKDSLLVVPYAHDRTTAYTYDKNNRVKTIDHPGDLAEEYFGYDEVGNLLWKQYVTAPATVYRYDDLNRLTSIWYSFTGTLESPLTYPTADPDVAYTYVGGSRLRSTVTNLYDGVNAYLSSYTYDLQDRLLTYTPPAPSGHGDITYTYNALGQKASITNGSLAVNYDYYANGWLKRVRNGTSLVSAYTYDEVGNRSRVDMGNTTYTTYDYDTDPRYRVSAIRHYDSTNTLLASPGILYASRDSAGNPLSMQDWNGTTAYTYDDNSRLTAAGSASYGYDWVGNRTSPNGLLYNAADQLYSWPGQHQYTYLGTGSLEYQEDSTGQTVQKTYSYTPTNLLESVVHAGVNDPSEMTWDADGNRVAFTSSEGTGEWQYVYDTTAGIPAVIGEVWPDDFWAGYIREPGGALIASAMYPGSSPVYHYYHFDALGSTRLITDNSGDVTDTYSYDAWGNTTHDTGSITQPYQYVGQLGYYTHYQDTNLQMLQLGVRFYDPGLGRFTQVDPLRDMIDWYLYVDSSPLTCTDPTGLCRKGGCTGGVGGKNRTCKSCWGFGCHGDIECPPKGGKKPIKPIVPPPSGSGDTLYNPEPPPDWTSIPPYMLPPGASEMVGLLNPSACRNFLCIKWIKDVERNYVKLCGGEKHDERKADCDKLEQYLEDLRMYCQ